MKVCVSPSAKAGRTVGAGVVAKIESKANLMQNQKIRIRLKAFDYKLIDQFGARNRGNGQAHRALWSRARSAADLDRAF